VEAAVKKGPSPRSNAGGPRSEPRKVPSPSVGELPVIYLAAPLDVLESPFYELGFAAVQRHRPGMSVLGARDLFRDTDDWKAWWPAVLDYVTEIVFLTDVDDSIGAGVFQEALDGRLRGLPVSLLDYSGTLHPINLVTFRFLADAVPSRIAEVLIRRGRR